MRLDQTITRCFPILAKFIEREIPLYRFNPPVFNAFRHFGQFTPGEAAKALTFGTSDPIIDARMMDDFGVYLWRRPKDPAKPRKKNRKIWLARAMCRDFERIDGDYKIVTNIDFIIKVTILHEMVHWGDLRDAVEQPDVLHEDPSGRLRMIDVGFQFELEAFGGIVDERNWRQYRRSKTR